MRKLGARSVRDAARARDRPAHRSAARLGGLLTPCYSTARIYLANDLAPISAAPTAVQA
jgi:hypothetical protein